MLVQSGYGSIPMVRVEALNDESQNELKEWMFLIGSYLSEPFLKSDEYLKRCYTIEALNGNEDKINCFARKFFLGLGIIGWGVVGLVTTGPAFFFGALPTYFQKIPFIYSKYEAIPKTLPVERVISMLSWNVCCISAGLTISDGCVTPTSFRVDRILESIIDVDADITCLCEVFDVITARYFKQKLSEKGYCHFFSHIGPKAIGLSSGLFIASRYNVQNPEFSVYSQSHGWASYSEKGVFSFDVVDNARTLAKFHVTHLQHSDNPASPKLEEINSREHQLGELQEIVNRVAATMPQIITGDLNMDDEELKFQPHLRDFSRGTVQGDEKTWGGDAWSAIHIKGETPTPPMNLDYTLGKNVELTTKIAFDTFFEEGKFTEKALSDHRPLLSYIKI